MLTIIGRIFIACAILSIILGVMLAKFDSIESGYDKKKEVATIDSLHRLRLSEQDVVNKERLDAKDRENKIRDSLSEIRRLFQMKQVEDSVRSVKFLLNSKGFQYEALSLELKLANQEKLLLEKEFNSPRIDLNIDASINNPELILDTINDIYIMSVYKTKVRELQ